MSGTAWRTIVTMRGAVVLLAAVVCACGPGPAECRRAEQTCYVRDVDCRTPLAAAGVDEGSCDGVKAACLAGVATRQCTIEGPLGVTVDSPGTDALGAYRLLDASRRTGSLERRLREFGH